MSDERKMLLLYDELRTFVDKTKVQGSVLLPMVTSFYEQNHWQNATKNKGTSQPITNAHLSMIGCCTDTTYSDMWTRDAISIGFPNRLFIVYGGRDQKVAWPKPPDQEALGKVKEQIRTQIGRLSPKLKFGITPEAENQWRIWYEGLPDSEHVRRLDVLGFKLMGLLTLTTDKAVIDEEVIKAVTAILDYELRVRIMTDPIDADNKIALMEERVRRVLAAKGPLKHRALRNATHADRFGLWAFETALKNLGKSGDISLGRDDRYVLVEASPNLSPIA